MNFARGIEEEYAQREFPDTGILNFAPGIEEVTTEKREYAQREFPDAGILNFVLGIDEVTTKKRDNLIPNVAGCIAACFVDMLLPCGVSFPTFGSCICSPSWATASSFSARGGGNSIR